MFPSIPWPLHVQIRGPGYFCWSAAPPSHALPQDCTNVTRVKFTRDQKFLFNQSINNFNCKLRNNKRYVSQNWIILIIYCTPIDGTADNDVMKWRPTWSLFPQFCNSYIVWTDDCGNLIENNKCSAGYAMSRGKRHKTRDKEKTSSYITEALRNRSNQCIS